MTSETWPYALDARGFPIVSCFLNAAIGQKIVAWQSYVVLPHGEAGFDYLGTAWGAGWSPVGHDRWCNGGEQFVGNARSLCFYIGIGPDWKAWGHIPYKERREL